MKTPGVKLKGKDKFTKKKIALVDITKKPTSKPKWIRTKLPTTEERKIFANVKTILENHNLNTVCEEASCPNIGECFSNGTATFMIMGDICTRRCPFCDVGHGRPLALDADEPINLAKAITKLNLQHVVITSVNRDDLKDGGANHFAACIKEIRNRISNIAIEILVPDFRKHADLALQLLKENQPDIINHNLETVPSLYKTVRPGADYEQSLNLLKDFREQLNKNVLTKSGLMLGIGETKDEVIGVLKDLRKHGVNMLTLGQYLQPTAYHLPVTRFLHPDEFKELAVIAKNIGFEHVASAPLVRSSYRADKQFN